MIYMMFIFVSCSKNQLKTGSQGLIQTGLSLANGTGQPKYPKPVLVYVLQMEYALKYFNVTLLQSDICRKRIRVNV